MMVRYLQSMQQKSLKIGHHLASAGICSRRNGEALVKEGRVSVNGGICLNPAQRVQPSDTVLFDGKPLPALATCLYSYYKPVKTLVTHAKTTRTNIFELLPPAIGRVISVGRLDYYSEGLILLTNSNELCSKLMHSQLPRKYKLLLDNPWQTKFSEHVSKPFTINQIRYQPWKVKHLQNNWIIVTLTEGKNREIRNVCTFFNLNIKRLIRVQFGPYKLFGQAGDLQQLETPS